jgi:cation diffusion facilitator family transporter
MIKLLAELFIKDPDNTADPAVREKYGVLCGGVGILFNVILFAFKFGAGIIAKSVAVTADAFNNLSDAGSSVITVLGFRLASKKPDADHPFGHGRIEYIAGLIVSFLIVLAGVELCKSSVRAVISPEPVERELLPVVILAVSILVKLYMYFYNHATAQKISSPTMEAVARDSLSDTVSTFVVLVSVFISPYTKLPLDGIAGIIVSAFIVYSGIISAKETINPLLGLPPTKEFTRAIEKEVLLHKPISGIHDLVVHNYGPGRLMISLHAEVPGSGNVFELHDAIDNAETDLEKKFNCQVTIHLDPIDSGNPEVAELNQFISGVAEKIDKDITIHDLRIVPGKTHTNVIFDAVNPNSSVLSDDDLKKILSERIYAVRPECNCVINIDRSFV